MSREKENFSNNHEIWQLKVWHMQAFITKIKKQNYHKNVSIYSKTSLYKVARFGWLSMERQTESSYLR